MTSLPERHQGDGHCGFHQRHTSFPELQQLHAAKHNCSQYVRTNKIKQYSTKSEGNQHRNTSKYLVSRFRRLSGDGERSPLIVSGYRADSFHGNLLVLDINHLQILHHDCFTIFRFRRHWLFYTLARSGVHKRK